MPSPHRQGRRALAGTLTIVALATLALGIFFLDRVLTFFRRTYTVVAVFPTAPGLRTGSPVWVAGVPVGRIRRIALLPPRDTLARVALDLQLRRSVAPQLRRDSRVRFASLQMIGEKVVEVLPGSPRSPQLRDGDTLHVGRDIDPTYVMGRANEVRLALDSLRDEAAGLGRRFALRRRELTRALDEASLARRELAALQAELGSGSPGRLATIDAAGGPLDRLEQRAAELRRLVGQAQERASRTGRQISPARRDLAARARALQADLAALRALTQQPVGTAGQLQRDSALEQAVTRARAQLDSLTTEARKRPWRFVF